MDQVVEFLVSAAILVGGVFALVGSIGLARLPDFYLRLHGPTKASTLGVGGTILASLLFFSWQERALQLQEVLIALFLFITAPVSAHMLAKAAMHRDLKRREDTRGRPWKQ
ncbi:Na+/H+ antiporter subunit G [Alloalcanivorax profundimaris]|jgi:multicomponent K+:H+ antiporter subunit G|uniref:Monovalent cation/H+ antiporter subunit G n=1 Tax=Alloalcanivorax profundimaris TaxID=2735259 RepID=A0ABS0AWU8_9GAMM|nr:Na+/H+ antiporter subunit G [Alloalcanivorax profundimaris]MAO58624.1 Na+/H+ antiporter subunit G [Alcanivorax sp.]MBM1142558.1 Na+/H+ antiporter subunit G [Alcanivorax sp. ZXX171]MCQ6260519.1 Na+/H+ antiporter subunit G [Alcanivorax sp. MM125-6]QJX02637.1 Na+/H+ antiporter subunit G [Alcanivorax sp. IO_7]MAY09476.1 Na+/H+ antiporter subunit G [Alcanivorax sp.]|tara:strand:- start:4235 stop:4567 length:333 start_codon:yes stop_codon:yes gene_type:complete